MSKDALVTDPKELDGSYMLQLNNVEVDTASLWDSTNKRYTMNTANAGRYFVGAVGSMKNGYNSTTNIFGTYIRKNGI